MYISSKEISFNDVGQITNQNSLNFLSIACIVTLLLNFQGIS